MSLGAQMVGPPTRERSMAASPTPEFSMAASSMREPSTRGWPTPALPTAVRYAWD
jgi:hypothetical protein